MNFFQALEARFCINPDRREVSQAYFRFGIFLVCLVYVYFVHNTLYLQLLTFGALLATLTWLWLAWRRVGKDTTRHIGALAYDCFVLGLVMVGLGRNFMGLFAVLLWISIGYGIRYRSPLYLKLGMLFSIVTFVVSAMITEWKEWEIFVTLLVTLIFVPLAQLGPMSRLMTVLDELDVANRELDEANKTKAKFISNVSHDLLTPVSSIIGYCGMAPPSIEGIRTNAFQLARQIRAILGVAAKDDLLHQEHHEAFKPLSLLNEVRTVCQPLAVSRGITITIDAPACPTTLLGPVHAISICLINLTNNAARHSGGSEIVLSYALNPDGIEFRVQDNGRGIPREQSALVFDRFHRGEASTVVEGLGLGLSIVKDTVERLGGWVKLEDQATGASFRLSFPAAQVRDAEHNPDATPAPIARLEARERTSTLLFVDDELQSLKAWSGVLRASGYHLHAASQGTHALAAIEAGNAFDVCIVDYRMPDMDGLALARRIRTLDPQASIILITADTIDPDAGVFREALDLGEVDLVLGKPLHPATLLAAIEQAGSTRVASSLAA